MATLLHSFSLYALQRASFRFKTSLYWRKCSSFGRIDVFDANTLNNIDTGSDINNIDRTKQKNLQRSLSWMTYPISVIDGLIGSNTRSAFAEYKIDIGETDVTTVTAKSKNLAIEKIEETQSILQSDVSSEEKTKLAIAALCENLGIGLKTQVAYVLATAQWETNHTFEPV